VFEYLILSEAGNILTVTIGVLGFVARSFNDKLEQIRKEDTEYRKESHSQFTVLTQAVNSLTNQVSTKFAEQDVNIQWMRGDFGVVSRGRGPSNQVTKPATDEPSEDEDSSATNT
jgi:hypothetical protein